MRGPGVVVARLTGISQSTKVTVPAFGATDCYSVHPKPVGSVRPEGEAMRLFSEVTGVLAVVVLYVIVVLSLFYPVLWIVFDWLPGMIVG